MRAVQSCHSRATWLVPEVREVLRISDYGGIFSYRNMPPIELQEQQTNANDFVTLRFFMVNTIIIHLVLTRLTLSFEWDDCTTTHKLLRKSRGVSTNSA